MPAAAPGTETLSLTRDDGSALAVTLHYDPASRAWADPAVTAEGAGGGVLCVDPGRGDGGAVIAIEAGVPIPAAVLVAFGFPDRAADMAVTLSARIW